LIKLVETTNSRENSNPWLYLNNVHSDFPVSDEPILKEGFSDEMLEYLKSEGINEDTDASVCAEFEQFIKDSDHTCFRLDGYDPESGACTKYMSGINRHKVEYRKRVWAKIQCLNGWYEQHHSPITMCTFTTFQNGLTKWEQIELLQTSFERAKKMLNKYLGTFSYIWVMESHESGYSHIHMLIFKAIPRELRQQLHELWITKYNPGASIEGHRCNQSLDFKISKGQRNLKSAAAYVFSYVGKTLKPESLEDKTSGYFLQSAWLWKMSQRDTDYKGVRTWGCSRDLSKVMKMPESDSGINWFRFSVNVPAKYKQKGGWYPLWVDDDMAAYIDRINEFDASLAVLDQDSLKTCKDVIFI
jgi:hypothetical protein